MPDACVVLVTAPDEEVAARICRGLVEEGLVACGTIVPRVRSVYRWEGEVCDESEALIVLKTDRARVPEVAPLAATRDLAAHSSEHAIALVLDPTAEIGIGEVEVARCVPIARFYDHGEAGVFGPGHSIFNFHIPKGFCSGNSSLPKHFRGARLVAAVPHQLRV